jgi:hypothetical protein
MEPLAFPVPPLARGKIPVTPVVRSTEAGLDQTAATAELAVKIWFAAGAVKEITTGFVGANVVMFEIDPYWLLVPPFAIGNIPVTCDVKSIEVVAGVCHVAEVADVAVMTWPVVGGVIEITTGAEGVVVVIFEIDPYALSVPPLTKGKILVTSVIKSTVAGAAHKADVPLLVKMLLAGPIDAKLVPPFAIGSIPLT